VRPLSLPRVALAGLCAVILVASPGCSRAASSATPSKKVKLASVVVDLPKDAWKGVHVVEAAKAAIEDVNASGEARRTGYRFELETRDMSGRLPAPEPLKPSQTPVKVGIVGGLDHASAYAEERSAVSQGLPYISLDSVALFTTKHPSDAPSVFLDRIAPTTIDQATYAGQVLAESYQLKKVGVIHDGTPYGKTLAFYFDMAFRGDSTTRTVPPIYGPTYGAVTTATQDLTPVVTQLLGNEVDAVFFGTRDPVLAARLSKAAKMRGLNVPIVGGDAIRTASYVGAAGPTYAERDVSIAGLLPLGSMPRGEAFLQHYAKASAKPDPIDAYAYDAVTALCRATMKAGTDPAKVAQTLRSTSFRGVTGVVGFDANGQPLKPTRAVYEVSGGAWRAIDLGS
jgi:ABC-type branched-subunit amino acid transport system substrate-binding protein